MASIPATAPTPRIVNVPEASNQGTGQWQPQQSGLRNPVFELLIPASDYIYGLIQRGRKGLHPNRPHLTILTREFMCIALLSSLSCPDRVEKTEATGNLEVKVGT